MQTPPSFDVELSRSAGRKVDTIAMTPACFFSCATHFMRDEVPSCQIQITGLKWYSPAMYPSKILRKLVLFCLLLTLPVLSWSMPTPVSCDATHHAVSMLQQQHDMMSHCHDAGQGKDAQLKHCNGYGCCCLSLTSVTPTIVAEAPGSEQILLVPPRFTPFIPETLQRPPSLLSA